MQCGHDRSSRLQASANHDDIRSVSRHSKKRRIMIAPAMRLMFVAQRTTTTAATSERCDIVESSTVSTTNARVVSLDRSSSSKDDHQHDDDATTTTLVAMPENDNVLESDQQRSSSTTRTGNNGDKSSTQHHETETLVPDKIIQDVVKYLKEQSQLVEEDNQTLIRQRSEIFQAQSKIWNTYLEGLSTISQLADLRHAPDAIMPNNF